MGKALYRKYRPASLSEIIGQEHITGTLERALKQGMISHAYLLTGPRGVGKTSIARILAYEVNGLPYDDEGTHLDIIEIDAASNRRIDEIRELKERVFIAPTSAKYKVYIIDEVHMLTKEAFNALLKTLEEPPEHAIFILATTEAHKVPATIISRTQRFTFKPVDTAQVAAHLKEIAKKEKMTIDDEALDLIAAHGEGSFRDSISLLDQVRHHSDRVTLAAVQQAVGQAPDALLTNLLTALGQGDIQKSNEALEKLRTQGVQAGQLAHQLSQLLRHQLVENQSSLPPETTLQLLAQLLQVPAASDPGVALELALYGAALERSDGSHQPSEAQSPTTAAATTAPQPMARSEKKTSSSSIKTNTTDKPTDKKQAFDESVWPEVLAAMKGKHNTLYGIARMAKPTFEKDKLLLSFGFAFHKKRLDANKQVLMDIIYEATGSNIEVECVLEIELGQADNMVKPEIKPAADLNLETISNIFGGAEIVE